MAAYSYVTLCVFALLAVCLAAPADQDLKGSAAEPAPAPAAQAEDLKTSNTYGLGYGLAGYGGYGGHLGYGYAPKIVAPVGLGYGGYGGYGKGYIQPHYGYSYGQGLGYGGLGYGGLGQGGLGHGGLSYGGLGGYGGGIGGYGGGIGGYGGGVGYGSSIGHGYPYYG